MLKAAVVLVSSFILLASTCIPAVNGESVPDSGGRQKALHLLNRISFGPRPGDVEAVLSKGVEKYVQEQLNPQSIKQPAALQALVSKSPALTMTPAQLFIKYGRQPMMIAAGLNGKEKRSFKQSASKEDREKIQQQLRQNYIDMYQQLSDAKLMRSVYSPRQLEELMTDFWFNHFNVSFDKGLDHLWVGSYEEQAIRPHVLGNFRDLLGATAHHAAMLFYLDNWQNTVDRVAVGQAKTKKGRFSGINENYARELMELHTLGVDGGYTQQDVISLARILTGHGLQNRRSVTMTGVGMESTSGYFFDRRRHDFSDKKFLGQTIKGEGKGEIDKALDILARHPSTARHISYQLAQYFVDDKPPPSLVNKLTQTFQKSNGNIKTVMNELLHSSEFWSATARRTKYKTPYRYVVSSLRVTNSTVMKSRPIVGFLQMQGMPLYKCLTPDGYKNTESAWLNPTGLLQRIEFATALGSGRHPAARPREASLAKILDLAGIDNRTKTGQVINSSHERLKVALVLGSPEFMKY